MTDPRNLEADSQPKIKSEQEFYPPRRYDDEDMVEQEEKQFGMSMWIGIAAIGLLFLIVLLVFAF